MNLVIQEERQDTDPRALTSADRIQRYLSVGESLIVEKLLNGFRSLGPVAMAEVRKVRFENLASFLRGCVHVLVEIYHHELLATKL